MVNYLGGAVTLVGLAGVEKTATMNLASGITASDVGKPVKLDTTANNQVALAGDGDIPIGVLQLVEDRKQEGILVGNILLTGVVTLNYASGDTVAVGNKVVGAGNGEVKVVGSPTVFNTTLVIAKRATGGVSVREVDVIFKTL